MRVPKDAVACPHIGGSPCYGCQGGKCTILTGVVRVPCSFYATKEQVCNNYAKTYEHLMANEKLNGYIAQYGGHKAYLDSISDAPIGSYAFNVYKQYEYKYKEQF